MEIVSIETQEQSGQIEDVLNVQEAALYMKCSVSAVYRDTALGLIPCIRKGKRVLFLKSQLLQWLQGMSDIPQGVIIQK